MTQEHKANAKPKPGIVLLQAVVPAIVGAILYYKTDRQEWAGVLCGIGTLMLISGFLIPALFWKLERFGSGLGRALGVALTWILLTPVFYFVFVPGRLILALQRKDPMCRGFKADVPTYWVSRPPVSSKADYKRQF